MPYTLVLQAISLHFSSFLIPFYCNLENFGFSKIRLEIPLNLV